MYQFRREDMAISALKAPGMLIVLVSSSSRKREAFVCWLGFIVFMTDVRALGHRKRKRGP